MANALIAYTTGFGHTQKVARHIGEALRARGHSAELYDVKEPKSRLDWARYEFAFVGAPIHAGGYPRAIQRFIREQRGFLEQVPSAFFSVGLSVASRTHDGRAQTMPLVEKLAQKTGWHPRRAELIAGDLPYSKYNFLIRFVMRGIAKREGGDTDTSRDYEYTDWDAVARFAEEFAAEAVSRAEPAAASV